MTVHFAETWFRWLMRAYPLRFRRTHGLALFELFRDEARDARDAHGTIGLLWLLARTTGDTLKSAPGAHLRALRHGRQVGEQTQPPPAARPAAPSESQRPARPIWPTRFTLGWAQDVRIALRHLRKSPGFTIVAVTMLAAGIGVNTTVFSLMNAVLLRPLASRDSDRVVRVVVRSTTGGASGRRFSGPEFNDYRERATTLEDLSAVNLATFGLDADGRTDQLLGEIVSGRYLSLLGIRATQGRLLVDTDDKPGSAPAAVISDGLWRHRFGGEAVLGRSVLLNRKAYTIVGVAEPSAVGSFVGVPVDVWVPIETSDQLLGVNWRTDRSQRDLMLVGRMRRGIPLQRAQAEVQSITNVIARDFGDGAPGSTPATSVLPARIIEIEPATLTTGDQRRLLRMFLSLLLGLVALVLLIACANVANLMLARVLGRRRELAVRVALGASRWRLARMLMVEGLILAVAGGGGALLLSIWTSQAFANFRVLPTLTLRLDLRPDARVIAFSAIAALASAVVLGLIGSLQAIKPDITPALKEDSTSSIGGRTTGRVRAALAAVQITVSLLLLIGAALFTRSVRSAGAIGLGFEPRGVVALDVGAVGGRTSAQTRALLEEVVRKAATLSDVQAAAVSTRAPLDSSTPLARVNPGEAVVSGDRASPTVTYLVVSAGYFDVVKTPIVAGRPFADTDDAREMPVAIVNETLAKRFWPEGDPIGRRLWVESVATATPTTPCIVVGVAKDSKYVTLGEERRGHIYLPFAQQPRRGMTLLVRSRGSSDRLLDELQSLLYAVDPHLQGFFGRTLTDHVGVSLLPIRVAASMTTLVAGLALGLALVGLYSLVSFLVAERTHEMGLRMALGAGSGDVLRLVLGYGIRLAGIGLAIGIPVAAAASRLLGSLLYGVSPTDPLVFVAVSVTLMAVATAACYVPARRAMRLDPLQALRNE
jgi:predicted permease